MVTSIGKDIGISFKNNRVIIKDLLKVWINLYIMLL